MAVDLHVEGTRVHAEHTPARGKAVGAAILLHGLNSSMQEFGPLPGHLAAAGVHALAFDQRGFGASAGERGRTGLDRILAETDVASDWVRDTLGTMPMVLVGHSLGASLALAVLTRRRRYQAGVAAHPVRNLLEEIAPLARVGYHVLGRLNRRRLRRGEGSRTVPYRVGPRDLFADPEARRAMRDRPFLLPDVNLGNYDFACTMDATDWAAAVRVPVLCILSTADRLVDPRHQQAVCDALGDRSDRIVHDAGHSLWLDRGGSSVSERVAEWCARTLGERP